MSHLWPTPNEIALKYQDHGAMIFSDLQHEDIDIFLESWNQMKLTLESIQKQSNGIHKSLCDLTLKRLDERKASK